MYKFMFVTTAMFSWAFYEMSGGADFTPAVKVIQEQTPVSAEVEHSAPEAVIGQAPKVTPRIQMINGVEYVDFKNPIILPAPGAIPTPQPDGQISQASFGGTQPAVQESAARDLRIVLGNNVNVRLGAGRAHPVLTTVPSGTEAEMLEQRGDWVNIRLLETGETGWMAAWLISD